MKRILAPSLLSADFMDLRGQLNALKETGVTALHYDVMDGSFVPSISFGSPVLKCIRKGTDLMLDVHMMVREPDSKLEEMKNAGADRISVHAEACTHLDRTVNHIKSLGLQAGVVLNPATPVGVLEEILPLLDFVLLMTVNPGYGGQSYIPYCTDKIKRLRACADRVKPSLSIQVDGGITLDNVRTVLAAGADNIVSGSAVFKGNIKENAESFLKILGEYE